MSKPRLLQFTSQKYEEHNQVVPIGLGKVHHSRY